MRKSIIVVLALIIGVVIIGVAVKAIQTFNVNEEFTIVNNSKEIQKHLTVWQNRGMEVLNPTLIKVEHLGETDTYVALFENNTGDLGIATLKKGSNDKLKILNTHYGSTYDVNFARYLGIHSNKGNYGIIFGKNPTKDMHSIRAELMDDNTTKFTVLIPEEEYFIVTKQLPEGTSSKVFADLFLFDKNNKQLEP